MSLSIRIYTQGSYKDTLDVLLREDSPLQETLVSNGEKDYKSLKPKDLRYNGMRVMYFEPDLGRFKILIEATPNFEALDTVIDLNNMHGELYTQIENQYQPYLGLYLEIGKHLNKNNIPYFIKLQEGVCVTILGGQNPSRGPAGVTFRSPHLMQSMASKG